MHTRRHTHPLPSFLPRFTPTSSKAVACGIRPCAERRGQNSPRGWPSQGLSWTLSPPSAVLPLCVQCHRTVQKLLTVAVFPT